MKNVKWLFFDIGGVLIDESKLTQWKINTIYQVAKKFLPRLRKKKIVSRWPWASQQKGGLAKNIFLLLLKNPLLSKSAYQQYYKLQKVRGKFSLPFRPGVKEVINKLAKKYQLGIIANQPKEILVKMKKFGLYYFFSHHGVSELSRLYKPDPAFFKLVLRQCHAKAFQSVMIDDNIGRALLPAKKLGFITVWYRLSKEKTGPNQTVDYIIDNLKELLNIF